MTVNAGVDMLMVAEDWMDLIGTLKWLNEQGRITIDRIDDAVSRILHVKASFGLLDEPKPSKRRTVQLDSLFGRNEHRALAKQAVQESLVLLKNHGNVLPLKRKQKVLLIGDGADNIPMQCGGWALTWQGTDTENRDFPDGTSLYEGVRQIVEDSGGSVTLSDTTHNAEDYDVAVVAFGEQPYAEGYGDVHHLGLSGIDSKPLRILSELRAKGVPTVSVLFTGRPLWINPELNRSQAFGVAWLPGTEDCAMAELMFEASDSEVQPDLK